MKQTTRTLVMLGGLLVVASAVIAYAFFGVHDQDVRDAKNKDHHDRLFAPERPGEHKADGGRLAATFNKITITAKGDTTVLTREGDGAWKVISPIQADADRLSVDAVTSQLQNAKFKAQVEAAPTPASLQKYGLAPPEWTVEAEAVLAGSTEVRKTRIEGGVENTYDGTVFLRRDDSPAVFSAEGGVRWAMQKNTYDLRLKEVLAVDESKATALEVKTTSNAWSATKDPADGWKITAPITEFADQVLFAAFFSSLKADKATAFHPDTADNRRDFGFDKPLADVTLSFGSEKTRFRFTEVVSDGGTRFFALREDGPQTLLFEVNPGAAHLFDRYVKDVVDRSLLRFKKDQVVWLSFQPRGGGVVTVQRSVATDGGASETWNLTAPKVGVAKTFKMAAMLWTLGSLKAAAVVVPKPRPAELAGYGLDPKSASVITLAGIGNSVLATLTVGKTVPGKPNMVFAIGTRGEIVELDSSRLSDFPTNADELLDGPLPPDAGR